MVRLSWQIYSESEDSTEAENTEIQYGKWSLIWWLLTNKFDKNVYSNRYKIEITLRKKRLKKIVL